MGSAEVRKLTVQALANLHIDDQESAAIRKAIDDTKRGPRTKDDPDRNYGSSTELKAIEKLLKDASTKTTIEALTPGLVNDKLSPKKAAKEKVTNDAIISILQASIGADGKVTTKEEAQLREFDRTGHHAVIQTNGVTAEYYADGRTSRTYNYGRKDKASQENLSTKIETGNGSRVVDTGGAVDASDKQGRMLAVRFGPLGDWSYHCEQRSASGKVIARGDATQSPPKDGDTVVGVGGRMFVRRGTWTFFDENGKRTGIKDYGNP